MIARFGLLILHCNECRALAAVAWSGAEFKLAKWAITGPGSSIDFNDHVVPHCYSTIFYISPLVRSRENLTRCDFQGDVRLEWRNTRCIRELRFEFAGS